MGKLRPIQKSFASGEITPKLRSRPDLKTYHEGVERLENWVTTPYGSIVKRNGTQFIDEVSDTVIFGRLFTFRVEDSNTFVIVVTEDDIRVYNKTAAELEAGGNLVLNPSFDQQGDDWNTIIFRQTPSIVVQTPASIVFVGGLALLNSGNAAHIDVDFDFPDGDITQTVSINPTSAELTQEIIGVTAANEHRLTLAIAAFSADGQVTDFLSIGTTEGASDIPFTVDPQSSNIVTFTPGVVNFWISYKIAWDDSRNPTVAGVFVNEPAITGDPATVSFDSFTIVDTVAAGGEDVVSFPSPYSEQQVRELQVDIAPGQSIMYFAVRASFTTKKLIRDPVTLVWTFEDVTFTGGPTDPPDAKWDVSGYPGCVTFFQGRLWLAGSAGFPANVWGSVAGEDNYEDFTAGGAEDDDALDLPMARNGVVVWIQGGKSVHVGMDNSEHVITGTNNNDILSPGNARTLQQSAYGSARIHAKWLSEKISYISNDRHRMYAANYNRETLGFLSDELSYVAEHIMFPGIEESAYSQNPRAHVWLVISNGDVVGATYQREAEAIGWHRHDTIGGDIKSITITEEFGNSILWLLVTRNDKLYLEKTGGQFMDSFIRRQFENPVTVVDGLDHLEGLPVQIIGDGAFAGIQTVVGGEVEVQHEASNFVVGIPITATCITLPIEIPSAENNLTTKLRRWNRIYARIIASIPPIINGVRVPTRTAPTPMDTREPNKTEDISVATDGWDRAAKVTIVQDLPFRTEVTGIYGELSEDGF